MNCKPAVLLMLSFALSSCVQTTPDQEMCKSGQNLDQRIATCTRLIESGQLSPSDLANVFHNRGAAWAGRRDYDRAIADYNEALRINPVYVLALYGRFMATQSKTDNANAKVPRKEAKPQTSIPADIDYVARGLAWAQKRDYDRAIADYTEALRVNPKDAKAYTYRAVAWSNKNNYERAVADYSEAIRINPQHVDAHNSAAWLLATAPVASVRNGTRAVEVARKAAELSSWKDGNILDTLAAAYAEAGNFPEAVRWQEKAMQFPEFMKDQEAGARGRLELYRNDRPYHQP
jgi:tetratricopeptide (TPR) repeat protein